MKGFSKNSKLVLVLLTLLCLISLQSNAQRRWTNDWGNVYRQKLNVSVNYPIVHSITPHYSVYVGFESILLMTLTKQMTGAVFPRFGYTTGTIGVDTGSISYKAYSVGVLLNKYFRLRRTRSSIMWNAGFGFEMKSIGETGVFSTSPGKTGFPKDNKLPSAFFQTGIYYVIPLGRNVQFIPGLEINTDFNNYTYPIDRYVSGLTRFDTQIDFVVGLGFNLN